MVFVADDLAVAVTGAAATVVVMGGTYVVVKGAFKLYRHLYTRCHCRVAICSATSAPHFFAAAVHLLRFVTHAPNRNRVRYTMPDGSEAGLVTCIPPSSPDWSKVTLTYTRQEDHRSLLARLRKHALDTRAVTRSISVQVRWAEHGAHPGVPYLVEFQTWAWDWTRSKQALAANMAQDFRPALEHLEPGLPDRLARLSPPTAPPSGAGPRRRSVRRRDGYEAVPSAPVGDAG